MTRLHSSFCQSVRARRRQLGLTQLQVAHRLRVSRNRVTEIESGRFSPTLDLIGRLAKALKTHPSAFFPA